MKATTITDGRIEVAERPDPEARDDLVVVRVHGAGINRADLLQLAGNYPAPPGSPPDIPGLEFAGVVEAVGPQATGVAVGAKVFGITGGGSQAEYVAVPAAQCAPVPDGLDLVAMGGAPEAFVTAHDALVTKAHLAAGEWLLVHAVGSGVGTTALQLANALGARVIGTARTESKLDRCRDLGLAHGIVPTVDRRRARRRRARVVDPRSDRRRRARDHRPRRAGATWRPTSPRPRPKGASCWWAWSPGAAARSPSPR